MLSARATAVAAMWALLALTACRSAGAPAALLRAGDGDAGVRVPGLGACGGGDLQLEPTLPVVVFVPGRGDAGNRYRELASRFEEDGQQAACFRYDGRADLDRTSGQLVRALRKIGQRVRPGRITVIGHSQGGLLARRALVQERRDALGDAAVRYALVTVGAPFGGVRASADCGRAWLRVLTLGASSLVCDLVAGEAWRDLTPGSEFVTRPGTLLPEVDRVVAVVTDERGACRRLAADGSCVEHDAVFTVRDQRNPTVEADPRLRRVEVAAGHVEIVGEVGAPPAKLIRILEAERILSPPRLARP